MLRSYGEVRSHFTSKIYLSGSFSGGTVEEYVYTKPIPFGISRRSLIKKRDKPEQKKRNDNLYRARKNVRQLIWCNLGQYTKFLTLTYAETMLDVDRFKKDFDWFRKKMSKAGYKLRYLYVLERQQERGEKEGNEGTIHCHMVIFNDEYIPWQDIKSAWSFGNIDIHVLNGCKVIDDDKKGEKIQDLGAYVSKYITKDCVVLPGNKVYCCSLGLRRPIEFKEVCYSFMTDNGVEWIEDYSTTDTMEGIRSITRFKFRKSKKWTIQIGNGEFSNALTYSQGRCNINDNRF